MIILYLEKIDFKIAVRIDDPTGTQRLTPTQLWEFRGFLIDDIILLF